MRIRPLLVLPILVSASAFLNAGATNGAEPWPAESSALAINLTPIDSDFECDLSGAFWNSHTETLWVCRNGPSEFTSKLWALVEDPINGFEIDAGGLAIWTSLAFDDFGDLEAVTQVDLTLPRVYVIEENAGRIKEYDVSVPGAPQCLLTEWITDSYLPEVGGVGAEGITFVPDQFLIDANFTASSDPNDPNDPGVPYSSTEGMGGLMFVSHQLDGSIFVFDLNPNGTFKFIGEYRTAFTDTKGLEFDRSTGLLFAFHDTDDRLTVLDLTSCAVPLQSYRQFNTVAVYDGPTTNAKDEGIAVAPIDTCVNGERNFFFSIDDGGPTSLIQYAQFRPGCTSPTSLEGTVNLASGTIEDVVFVNGSSGGALRQVTVCTNDPIDISLDASSAGSGAGRYWFYIWTATPSGGSFSLMPGGQNLGSLALPTPFHAAAPQPFRCLMGGVPGVVCNGVTVISPPGTASVPWTLSIPGGIAAPNAFTFQGVIEDLGANNPLGFSVTNGVVLNVR